jgi:phosphoribosylamine-glycine ligase
MKFLFVTFESLSADLAWQLKKEGHDVKMYCHNQGEKDVGLGFFDKVDEWESLKDWADVIIFDDIGFGTKAEQLRNEGKFVVGGSPYTDKLELDREFGQSELNSVGVDVLPSWNFTSFDEAIEFVKKNPDRYVLKPSGKAQSEKELLFVGQEEDGKDILQILEHYKINWSKKIKEFQMQKFAEGVEIAVGTFFNGKDFVMPICVNFEHKRLFPQELGPSTGEMGCYDEETEVLTRSGWKRFADVSYSDLICTLNPRTRIIEYQAPESLVTFSHHRKLISVRNRALDVLVTPDHNMYIETQQDYRKRRNKFRFVKAKDLQSQSLVMRTGTWVGRETSVFVLPSVMIMDMRRSQGQIQETGELEVKMDLWLKFLGIWLSDGYVSRRVGDGMGSILVGIAQKKSPQAGEIREMLSQFPLGFTDSGKGFYCYDKQLGSYLEQFGQAPEKFVPAFIKELSPRQIRLFLEWFAKGDATQMERGFRIFYSSSKRLADDIQELLLKIGRVGLVKCRVRQARRWIVNHFADSSRPQYEVIERVMKLNSWVDRRDMSTVDYTGKVYCATVKNHVMYVRRNGKPLWCGNTSMYWTRSNPVFERTLLKMKDKLAASKYVGYIDINCIANSRGIWPLEFTSRPGYPTISIQMEGITSDWGPFLSDIAHGNDTQLKTKKGYQVGVVICIPPWPFEDEKAFKKYSEGATILFRRQALDGIHIGEIKLEEGDWHIAGNSGYALVVTGSGATMTDAIERAYQNVRNVMIPNMFYRSDIGQRWTHDSDMLLSWGYI